ncbi:MAG: hypothetical protein LRZ88_03695, partial [Candidatus Cloacimonetes bacterium]|nr:hypothetical protein [Candidatus Cloacimonadota bacterium]
NENRVRIADVLVCTSSEAAFFSRPAASLDTRRVESSGFHVKWRPAGTYRSRFCCYARAEIITIGYLL